MMKHHIPCRRWGFSSKRKAPSKAGAVSQNGAAAPKGMENDSKSQAKPALTPSLKHRQRRRSSMKHDTSMRKHTMFGSRHVRFKGVAGPFTLHGTALLIRCVPLQ